MNHVIEQVDDGWLCKVCGHNGPDMSTWMTFPCELKIVHYGTESPADFN